MTNTNYLPDAPLVDSVVGNYQNNTVKIPITHLASMVGDGSANGGATLAAEVTARQAGDAAEATARTDAIAAAGVIALTSVGGTANAITATAVGLTAIADGRKILLIPTKTNEAGVVTLALNGATTGSQVRDADGAVLATGALVVGRPYMLSRVGSVWRIVAGLLPPADAAAVRNRASHTGTQDISTITGLDTALEAMTTRTVYMASNAGRFHFALPGNSPVGEISAGFTAAGIWKLPVETLGSGAAVVSGPNGLTFSPGAKYLRGLDVNTVPGGPFSRVAMALDLTVHGNPGAGSSTIARWDVASDVSLSFMLSIQSWGFLLRAAGPGAVNVFSEIYYSFGERLKVCMSVDYTTGELTLMEPDGTITTAPCPIPAALPDPVEIRVGQNTNMTLHNLYLFAE